MANSIAVICFYHRGHGGAQRTAKSKSRRLTPFTKLLLSLHQEPRQFLQCLRTFAEALQLRKRIVHQCLGFLNGCLNSKQRGIRDLLRRRILARRFSKLLRSLGDIEYVIHNLKRQANRQPESSKLSYFAFLRSSVTPSAHQTCSDQGSGL